MTPEEKIPFPEENEVPPKAVELSAADLERKAHVLRLKESNDNIAAFNKELHTLLDKYKYELRINQNITVVPVATPR